jgi:alkanesulfonate monooxygenase SsuD/methylene tetrahydromethanopterin reductase-like flavin-dependent oxidoreductase (luciferase family)
MPELEFYVVIDRTYPWFPPADDRESIGIDLSNSAYDADLGQQVLEQVVENAQHAEKLGFDGVFIFEQHNQPLALFPNALTGAAYLAGRTNDIRIVAAGPITNAYLTPVRLAEEIALIDTLSGGRLTVALPMGIGVQYHSMGVTNPAHARARYREAVELLYRIWTQDGPFSFEGEFFHVPYVNVWPRPRQAPHPPIFIPAAGSRETLELAAKYGFTYQAILTPRPVLLRNCQLFRDLCVQNGYESDPRQIAAVLSIHTAETDEQAREEAERHTLWTYQNVFRFPFHESFPPGHVSQASLRGMMSGGYRSSDPSKTSWDDLAAGDSLIAGSPETVRERLAEITGEMGAGRVIVSPDFTLPPWILRKSMALFAEEVIPHFRAAGAQAIWQREPSAGYKTATERVGRNPRRAGEPVVDVPGRGRVNLY